MDGWTSTCCIPGKFDGVYATALCFDQTEDLLWAGNSEGRVYSFLSPAMSSYTSVMAHTSRVLQIVTSDKFGIISLSCDRLHVFSRSGTNGRLLMDARIVDARTFIVSGVNHVILGTAQGLLTMDLQTGAALKFFAYDHVSRMCWGRQFLAVGRDDGIIDIIDWRTSGLAESEKLSSSPSNDGVGIEEKSGSSDSLLRVVASNFGHQGQVIGLECRDSTLYFCGLNSRYGSDRVVQLYDLRNLKSLGPVNFGPGAAFIKLHPKLITCVIMCSPIGQLQFLDTADPTRLGIQQVAVSSFVSCMDLSGNGGYLAIGDGDGQIHLIAAQGAKGLFTDFARQSQLSDIAPNVISHSPLGALSVASDVPLSVVGMPFYREELLSSWTDLKGLVVRMDTSRGISRSEANQWLERGGGKFVKQSHAPALVPRFLSDKLRTGEVDDHHILLASESQSRGVVPQRYSQLQVLYSRFGVHDFDFAFYNHTTLSGLEPNPDSDYVNALIQVLKWTPPIYNAVMLHAAQGEQKGENNRDQLFQALAFQFDMMDKARGRVCQASNFVRALKNFPSMSLRELASYLVQGSKVEGNSFSLIGCDSYEVLRKLRARAYAVVFRVSHVLAAVKCEDEWYLFNDFCVLKVSEDEVFEEHHWRQPELVALKQGDWKYDFSWREHLNLDVLIDNQKNEPRSDLVPRGLSLDEVKPGTLVAIDAEFVCISREEVDYRSDGARYVIRPQRLGLARVSVIRGEGPEKFRPIIDDYIEATEDVIDYFTAYSGIHPGDLNSATAAKPLCSLEQSYRKLWLLVNLGFVFVGHGLVNDFRIINIHMPENQVVDTLTLFSRPGQRNISLKFLSACLLDRRVQQGSHDSVEDADTALRLYDMYLDLRARGDVDRAIDYVYEEGRRCNWQGGRKWPG